MIKVHDLNPILKAPNNVLSPSNLNQSSINASSSNTGQNISNTYHSHTPSILNHNAQNQLQSFDERPLTLTNYYKFCKLTNISCYFYQFLPNQSSSVSASPSASDSLHESHNYDFLIKQKLLQDYNIQDIMSYVAKKEICLFQLQVKDPEENFDPNVGFNQLKDAMENIINENNFRLKLVSASTFDANTIFKNSIKKSSTTASTNNNSNNSVNGKNSLQTRPASIIYLSFLRAVKKFISYKISSSHSLFETTNQSLSIEILPFGNQLLTSSTIQKTAISQANNLSEANSPNNGILYQSNNKKRKILKRLFGYSILKINPSLNHKNELVVSMSNSKKMFFKLSDYLLISCNNIIENLDKLDFALYIGPSGIRCNTATDSFATSISDDLPGNPSKLYDLLKTFCNIDLNPNSASNTSNNLKKLWIKLLPNVSHTTGATPKISKFLESQSSSTASNNKKFIYWPLDLCFIQFPSDSGLNTNNSSPFEVENFEIDDPFAMVEDFIDVIDELNKIETKEDEELKFNASTTFNYNSENENENENQTDNPNVNNSQNKHECENENENASENINRIRNADANENINESEHSSVNLNENDNLQFPDLKDNDLSFPISFDINPTIESINQELEEENKSKSAVRILANVQEIKEENLSQTETKKAINSDNTQETAANDGDDDDDNDDDDDWNELFGNSDDDDDNDVKHDATEVTSKTDNHLTKHDGIDNEEQNSPSGLGLSLETLDNNEKLKIEDSSKKNGEEKHSVQESEPPETYTEDIADSSPLYQDPGAPSPIPFQIFATPTPLGSEPDLTYDSDREQVNSLSTNVSNKHSNLALTPKEKLKSIFAPLNFNPLIEKDIDSKYSNGGKFFVRNNSLNKSDGKTDLSESKILPGCNSGLDDIAENSSDISTNAGNSGRLSSLQPLTPIRPMTPLAASAFGTANIDSILSLAPATPSFLRRGPGKRSFEDANANDNDLISDSDDEEEDDDNEDDDDENDDNNDENAGNASKNVDINNNNETLANVDTLLGGNVGNESDTKFATTNSNGVENSIKRQKFKDDGILDNILGDNEELDLDFDDDEEEEEEEEEEQEEEKNKEVINDEKKLGTTDSTISYDNANSNIFAPKYEGIMGKTDALALTSTELLNTPLIPQTTFSTSHSNGATSMSENNHTSSEIQNWLFCILRGPPTLSIPFNFISKSELNLPKEKLESFLPILQEYILYSQIHMNNSPLNTLIQRRENPSVLEPDVEFLLYRLFPGVSKMKLFELLDHDSDSTKKPFECLFGLNPPKPFFNKMNFNTLGKQEHPDLKLEYDDANFSTTSPLLTIPQSTEYHNQRFNEEHVQTKEESINDGNNVQSNLEILDSIPTENLFRISSTTLNSKRADQKVQINQTGLEFWRVLNLEPVGIEKNFDLLLVIPKVEFSYFAEKATGFVDSIVECYHSCKLGEINKINSNAILEVDHFSGSKEEYWTKTRETLLSVAQILQDNYALNERKSFLLMIIDPFDDLSSLLQMTEITHDFENALTAKQSPDCELQDPKKKKKKKGSSSMSTKLPISFFYKSFSLDTFYPKSSDHLTVFTTQQYLNLALSLYNICPNDNPADDHLCLKDRKPFFTIAKDLPKKIFFMLTKTPIAKNLVTDELYLHVCYERSIDKNWCVASWTDQYGSINFTKSWYISNGMDGSESFENVANKILDITLEYTLKHSGKSYVILTRLNNIIPDDELTEWKRLSMKNNKLSLIVLTVEPESSTLILSNNPGPTFTSNKKTDDPSKEFYSVNYTMASTNSQLTPGNALLGNLSQSNNHLAGGPGSIKLESPDVSIFTPSYDVVASPMDANHSHYPQQQLQQQQQFTSHQFPHLQTLPEELTTTPFGGSNTPSGSNLNATNGSDDSNVNNPVLVDISKECYGVILQVAQPLSNQSIRMPLRTGFLINSGNGTSKNKILEVNLLSCQPGINSIELLKKILFQFKNLSVLAPYYGICQSTRKCGQVDFEETGEEDEEDEIIGGFDEEIGTHGPVSNGNGRKREKQIMQQQYQQFFKQQQRQKRQKQKERVDDDLFEYEDDGVVPAHILSVRKMLDFLVNVNIQ